MVGCDLFQKKTENKASQKNCSKAGLLEIDEAIDFGAARNFPSTWLIRWDVQHQKCRAEISMIDRFQAELLI